jgi:ribonuclease HI
MAGWLVLNTDASKPDASGDAAIGAILRQKPRSNAAMKVIAYISKMVGHMEPQAAEYQAVIGGLKLALRHPSDADNLQVFIDSATVADQIQQEELKLKPYMKELHDQVRQLLAEIEKHQVKIRISWLPRELNQEANQRASDAFLNKAGKAWLSPESSSMLDRSQDGLTRG